MQFGFLKRLCSGKFSTNDPLGIASRGGLEIFSKWFEILLFVMFRRLLGQILERSRWFHEVRIFARLKGTCPCKIDLTPQNPLFEQEMYPLFGILRCSPFVLRKVIRSSAHVSVLLEYSLFASTLISKIVQSILVIKFRVNVMSATVFSVVTTVECWWVKVALEQKCPISC